MVEERYLDGHDALFPDVATAWDEQVRSTRIIADMAARLAEFDGVPAAVPRPRRPIPADGGIVADLVEPAKAEALDKLGEGRQALISRQAGCGEAEDPSRFLAPSESKWLPQTRHSRVSSTQWTGRAQGGRGPFPVAAAQLEDRADRVLRGGVPVSWS